MPAVRTGRSSARSAPARLACGLLLAAGCLAPAFGARAAELRLADATIAELNAAMDAGALSSERLVELYLARIAAYDRGGPMLNAVLTLNPEAAARARGMDRERAARGRRSALHGIPVLIKDNLDTADMPTTAGSFMLKDSVPPDDAFLVRKLREAGAVVLGKLNMSEFASGGPLGSLGGATLNPHDPARTPAGSSGGTGAAVAAGFAAVGLGTDTGGSVRNPASANGIVGLKTTHGLLSRDGVVPLALSFDTVGPMARNVYDAAAALGAMTGVDPADGSTAKSAGRFETDYTRFLDPDALDGARIGVARAFTGSDGEVDWLFEAALKVLRDAGAETVDVEIPAWLLAARGHLYRAVRYREFRAQIADYLAATGPEYPKSLAELVDRSMTLTARRPDGVIPNPGRWRLMLDEEDSGGLADAEYVAVRDHGLPLVRGVLGGLMAERRLDAVVYPTAVFRPGPADPPPTAGFAPAAGGSPVTLANLSGFPDLTVPMGFTARGLPAGISFLGPAFSEPRLLALGHAFERLTRARRLPAATPPLPGEHIAW